MGHVSCRLVALAAAFAVGLAEEVLDLDPTDTVLEMKPQKPPLVYGVFPCVQCVAIQYAIHNEITRNVTAQEEGGGIVRAAAIASSSIAEYA